MRCLLFIVSIVSIGGISQSTAQTINSSDTISFYANAYLDKVAAFGNAGQVLIAQGNMILYKKNYGPANRENNEKVSDRTVFEIASASKFFTACAIMKLSEQGKLRLNDPLSVFFDNIPADKKVITIHQLLTHTSGLRGGDIVNDFDRISKKQLLQLIFSGKLIQPPGKKFIYSNAGYNLLAAIIERVSGKNYESYLRNNFFLPLKMMHTFENGSKFLLQQKTAIGYRGVQFNNGPGVQIFNPRTWGGGSISSTASDLLRFIVAVKSGKILSADSWSALTKEHVPLGTDNNYGYGCFPYHINGKNIVDIIGSTERGFNATIRLYLDDNITYIFLGNASQPMGSFDREFIDPRIRHFIYEKGKIRLPPPVQQDVLPTKLNGYYTNGTDTLECVVQHNTVKLTAKGQSAINTLLNYSPSQSEKIIRLNPFIRGYMNAYLQNDTTQAKTFLQDGEIVNFISERSDAISKFGTIKNYHITGCYYDADTNFIVSQVSVSFRYKTVNYFIMWNMMEQFPLIDYYEMNAPFTAFSLRFAADMENHFIAYDFKNATIKSVLSIHNQEIYSNTSFVTFRKSTR